MMRFASGARSRLGIVSVMIDRVQGIGGDVTGNEVWNHGAACKSQHEMYENANKKNEKLLLGYYYAPAHLKALPLDRRYKRQTCQEGLRNGTFVFGPYRYQLQRNK